MSFKTYGFFLGVLCFAILFVIRPPESKRDKERSQEKIATLEMRDFSLMSAENGKAQFKVVGKRGMRFEDRDEFWDFYFYNYSPKLGGLKSLKSKEKEEIFYVYHGVGRGELYEFDGGIDYKNSDGLSFWAFHGNYDAEKRIFVTQGEFEMENLEGKIRGINLHYDGGSGKITADSPRGEIWLEN